MAQHLRSSPRPADRRGLTSPDPVRPSDTRNGTPNRALATRPRTGRRTVSGRKWLHRRDRDDRWQLECQHDPLGQQSPRYIMRTA